MNPSDLSLPSRFTAFRSGQLEAAIDIASCDARFPWANAPTGAGKSLLGITSGLLANGRTLYVVSTRGLQDQIYAEFAECGAADIRGANNYRCGEHRTGCDVGGELGCLRRKEGGQCPYMGAVRRARASRVVTTNYAYWLSIGRQSGELLGQFDFMVLDEAHLAHDTLADHCSVRLDREKLERHLRVKLLESLDVDELAAWAAEVADGASIAARQRPQDRGLQEAAGAIVKLSTLVSRDNEWAADSTPDGCVVVPIWAGEYAESHLYRGIPKVLMMSATLLPEMRTYLGIEESQSSWYELPSSFSPRRRPFYFVRGTMPIRVDHRMDSGRWGMLVSRIDRYMGARLDHRGLVHTRSYGRQGEFVRESRHRDVMVAPKSWELRRAVERFKLDPPPGVLVSPAIEEGWDFAHDDARWQVLLKVPFVDTRSNLMKARTKDKTYSNLLTAQSIIQSSGRIMRAGDDWGETAIFDDHWGWFRGAVKWPGWFRDSWCEVEQAPEPLAM